MSLSNAQLASASPVPLFNPTNALKSAVKDVVRWFFGSLAEALIGFVNTILSGGVTRRLLFLHEDSQNIATAQSLPELNAMYDLLIPVFFVILMIGATTTAVTVMAFPYDPRTSLARLMERYFIAVLIVVLVGPLMWQAVFEIHHAVGVAIWDAGGGSGIEISLDREMFNTSQSISTVIATAVIVLYLNSGVVLTVILFWFILALRAVILAAGFVLTPILVGFWASDVGPGKYASLSAELFIKLIVALLFLGLLLAAILSSGGALIDQQGGFAGGVSTGQDGSGAEFETASEAATGEFSATDTATSVSINTVFPVFIWMGTMWVAITATGGLLGGAVTSGKSLNRGNRNSQESAEENTETTRSDRENASDGGESTGSQETDRATRERNSQAQSQSENGDARLDHTLRGKATTAGGYARRGAGTTLKEVGSRLDTIEQRLRGGSGEQETDSDTAESTSGGPEVDSSERTSDSGGQSRETISSKVESAGETVRSTSVTQSGSDIRHSVGQWHGSLKGDGSSSGNQDTSALTAGYAGAAAVGSVAAKSAAVYGQALASKDGTESWGYILDQARKSDTLSEPEKRESGDKDPSPSESTEQSDSESDSDSGSESSDGDS